ncbi:MAG: BamA/TamA family outer membrane protein [Bacteroidota bacterium]
MNSCSSTHRVQKRGGYLLTNHVVKTDRPGISVYDLTNFAQPGPNRKFLGLIRHRVWIYDAFSGKRDSKFKKWVRTQIGVAPVLLDSALVDNSMIPMKVYLNNKGYFKPVITRKIRIKGARATVEYQTHTTEPYRFGNISYSIKDDSIRHFVESMQHGTLLKSGKQYDAYLMGDERERITRELKDLGYYAFMREYVFFEVDTSAADRLANLKIIIKNVKSTSSELRDSVSEVPHLRYYINNIYLNTNQRVLAAEPNLVNDTLAYYSDPDSNVKRNPDFFLIYREKLRIRPAALGKDVFVKPGEPFSQKNINLTYNRLQNMSLSRYVSVNVVPPRETNVISPVGMALLDCDIRLVRSKVNLFQIEAEGTNSGGFVGLGGSFNYRNRNIFRGAEMLRLKLHGAFEIQPSLDVGVKGNKMLFNSHEYGIQTGIDFPRIVSPFRFNQPLENARAKTSVALGFNYQSKVEYLRYITSFSMGYEWNSSQTARHIFSPLDISSISIERDSLFTEYLTGLNDPKLLTQYTDHLIMALKYSFVFNNQNLMARKNFFYFRINMESAGNLLNLTSNLSKAETNENGDYTLFGIRYAQYLRTDLDFRYYRPLTQNQKVVYRAAFGIGVPYGNSGSLPFEKGFFAGGANGLRGWPVRSLGPGGYITTDSVSYENIGDIWIEANLEYRFPIYSFVKGTLFTDVGNVWLLKKNDDFKEGEFRFDRFLETMAFDGGFGFRFDFSFFIFRIDGGIPLYDPGKNNDDRWLNFSKFQIKNINWNFGIGFPF